MGGKRGVFQFSRLGLQMAMEEAMIHVMRACGINYADGYKPTPGYLLGWAAIYRSVKERSFRITEQPVESAVGALEALRKLDATGKSATDLLVEAANVCRGQEGKKPFFVNDEPPLTFSGILVKTTFAKPQTVDGVLAVCASLGGSIDTIYLSKDGLSFWIRGVVDKRQNWADRARVLSTYLGTWTLVPSVEAKPKPATLTDAQIAKIAGIAGGCSAARDERIAAIRAILAETQ